MNDRFTVKIEKRWNETQEIIGLKLVALGNELLPRFSAGAHIDIVTPAGMVRQYSLCGKPTVQDHYIVGILRDPKSRGASINIHEKCHEGDTLEISAPRNHFPLHPSGKSILIAAGIGVTPILSMSEELQSSNRDFELHYFTRSKSSAAFLPRINASPYSHLSHCYFDNETPEHRPRLAEILNSPRKDSHVYICGPSGFIDFVRSVAKEYAWQETNIHIEHFSNQVTNSGSQNDGSFDVRIASSGKVFTIPKDQSITQILANNGISIPVSCQEGVCGTCITPILSGKPEHRDAYFSEEEKTEGKLIMPCCSRALSDELVLDL